MEALSKDIVIQGPGGTAEEESLVSVTALAAWSSGTYTMEKGGTKDIPETLAAQLMEAGLVAENRQGPTLPTPEPSDEGKILGVTGEGEYDLIVGPHTLECVLEEVEGIIDATLPMDASKLMEIYENSGGNVLIRAAERKEGTQGTTNILTYQKMVLVRRIRTGTIPNVQTEYRFYTEREGAMNIFTAYNGSNNPVCNAFKT